MFESASQLTTIFGLIFFVLLFVFTIYSWMLGYHWFTYGTSVRTSRTLLTIYLSGGSIVFLVMGIILYSLFSVPYAG